MYSLGDLTGVLPQNDLLLTGLSWVVFFFAPLALAITTLLGLRENETTASSLLIGGAAVLTLAVVAGSMIVYIAPSGRGILITHLLSYVFGLALSVSIVLKQATSSVERVLQKNKKTA